MAMNFDVLVEKLRRELEMENQAKQAEQTKVFDLETKLEISQEELKDVSELHKLEMERVQKGSNRIIAKLEVKLEQEVEKTISLTRDLQNLNNEKTRELAEAGLYLQRQQELLNKEAIDRQSKAQVLLLQFQTKRQDALAAYKEGFLRKKEALELRLQQEADSDSDNKFDPA